MRHLCIILISLTLVGCASTKPNPEDPVIEKCTRAINYQGRKIEFGGLTVPVKAAGAAQDIKVGALNLTNEQIHATTELLGLFDNMQYSTCQDIHAVRAEDRPPLVQRRQNILVDFAACVQAMTQAKNDVQFNAAIELSQQRLVSYASASDRVPQPFHLIRVLAVSADTPNRDGIRADGKTPTSTDGQWWAALTELRLDAGEGQELRNVGLAPDKEGCDGPNQACSFKEVYDPEYSADGRHVTVKVKTWSNSVHLTVRGQLWGY